MGKKEPELELNKPHEKQPFWQSPQFNFWLYLFMILSLVYLFQMEREQARIEIPYSEFLQKVEQKQVKDVVITNKVIIGELKEDDPRTGKPKRFITVPLDDLDLAKELEQKGVKFTVRKGDNWLANLLFNWIIPFTLIFAIWVWFSRRMMGGRDFLSLGANKIRIHADTGPKVTFDDVAGVDEAKEELKEVIDFLKDPERITSLGGRMPKGVLLVGPPGTGKTLLAKAVAGEAGVPFFYISGSEFVEMFVGVGAARVRDLFQQAREKAPCIIFIDELDAIGRARGAGPGFGGHDEREQTLNQLLVEMDGFDPSSGVVVMAATNRPEILDKALLRAGRFDRQIVVDRPDLEAREAILRIHARRLKLADDVDLRVVAQRTPGMVGADLANVCNEAAIRAVRKGHTAVTMEDFEEAIDRIIAGPEKKHQTLDDDEKWRVAVHEAGHTMVAKTVPHADPVHKVSIIPRGIGALGYTLQLPVEDKYLSTYEEMRDQIAILMGGRVAEELEFGDVSSGASNDIERATEIARNMVTRLGMSEKLGPVTWGRFQESRFLAGQEYEERNYSERTAEVIDEEVHKLLDEGHRRAREILERRRAAHAELARVLNREENIDGERVDEIIRQVEGEQGATTDEEKKS
ncbi:MAG: ATP-dependent metallopeptidase FtsH/Yme1/Tma family protein [Gammaproteobacteria bacterium]|nr:MAG: ATP-dependent metallopeptidase FtsH/Yme1/Tma family protein [Gammaproteobacteria bacterium]